MKNKKIIVSVLLLACLGLACSWKITPLSKMEDKIEDIRASVSPILINGNSDWIFYKSLEYCTGNGTYSQPYIIDGLTINEDGPSCIHIENTNVYFIIRNCTLINSEPFGTGIEIQNVTNSQLIANNCSWKFSSSNSYFGIHLNNCYNNTIQNNTANNGWVGITLLNSNKTEISGNSVNNNLGSHVYSDRGYGIFLYESNNNSIVGNMVNYNAVGIGLNQSNYNLISGNTLLGNDYCIQISSHSEGNTVENNDCGVQEKIISGYNLVFLVCIFSIIIFIALKKGGKFHKNASIIRKRLKF